MVGERKVFEMLEEADETGKKLQLEYADNHKEANASPNVVVLV